MGIQLKNNASGTLATAISASDTGIVLTTGNGASFPALGAGDYFYATLESAGGTSEVIKVTVRSGDSMTVVRAQEGSTANSFAAGSRIELRVTARSVEDTALQEIRDREEYIDVRDYGATGDGTNQFTAINNAWTAALAAGKDLYFPAGVYSSGVNNMPFKLPIYPYNPASPLVDPADGLYDCKNITVFGDGPTTILRSDSVEGADVINLYFNKNLHFRDMRIMGAISGTAAGSNGISVVGGYDNLTFDNIWIEDMPYVDKALYLDGGKGLTVQTGPVSTAKVGSIRARNIYAKGCVYGLDYTPDWDAFVGKCPTLDVEITVENCFIGVVAGLGAAPISVPPGPLMNWVVRANIINCQRGAVLSRVHGGVFEFNYASTKTLAQKRLNPAGGTWNSVDSMVDGVLLQYTKNIKLTAVGFVGDVQYKVQLGGASGGTVSGNTAECDLYFDLAGSATTADFDVLNAGGNIVDNCRIYVTPATTVAALPALLYYTPAQNTVSKGPAMRLNSPTIAGSLGFTYDTNGVNVYNTVALDGLTLYAKQTGGSGNDLAPLGIKNHLGTAVTKLRQDGTIATAYGATASSVSTVVSIYPLYDMAGTIRGYIPVYQSYA